MVDEQKKENYILWLREKIRYIAIPAAIIFFIGATTMLGLKIAYAIVPTPFWGQTKGAILSYILLLWAVFTFLLVWFLTRLGRPMFTYVLAKMRGEIGYFWLDPGRQMHLIRAWIKPGTGELDAGEAGTYETGPDHIYNLEGLRVVFGLHSSRRTIPVELFPISEAIAKDGTPNNPGGVNREKQEVTIQSGPFSFDWIWTILAKLHNPIGTDLAVVYKVKEELAMQDQKWFDVPIVKFIGICMGVGVVMFFGSLALKVLVSSGFLDPPQLSCIVEGAKVAAQTVVPTVIPPLKNLTGADAIGKLTG